MGGENNVMNGDEGGNQDYNPDMMEDYMNEQDQDNQSQQMQSEEIPDQDNLLSENGGNKQEIM